MTVYIQITVVRVLELCYLHEDSHYPHEDVFPAAAQVDAGCMVDTPWIFKWVETIVLGVGWYSIWDNVI